MKLQHIHKNIDFKLKRLYKHHHIITAPIFCKVKSVVKSFGPLSLSPSLWTFLTPMRHHYHKTGSGESQERKGGWETRPTLNLTVVEK